MTARRPIVSVAGSRRQLPPGDHLVGAPCMRVRLANGLRAYIPLDANGELAIQLADASLDAVPVVGAPLYA